MSYPPAGFTSVNDLLSQKGFSQTAATAVRTITTPGAQKQKAREISRAFRRLLEPMDFRIVLLLSHLLQIFHARSISTRKPEACSSEMDSGT